MDDPTRQCENDTDKWKRATRGSCSQARAPFFCPLKWDSHFWLSFRRSKASVKIRRLINLPRHRNIQLPQNVLHFRTPQA